MKKIDKPLFERMISAAEKARAKAHAPYSNHPVGVALLADNGDIYAGCNIENAAYPLGQCAEATALGQMIMAGGRVVQHVVLSGPGLHACTPCGGCRQKLREFSGNDGVGITVCSHDGEILLETTLSELLPHSFGPDNLNEVGDNPERIET